MKTAFEELVAPHRARLRLHCYRMLGSSTDAEDTVQETGLTRAFRSRATLADAALVRPWLYRIATNVCLDELKDRPRRARGPEVAAPSDPDLPPAPATPEREWIEPVPAAWLDASSDPASAYARKESVALAFVAALQVLTPPQRAVLLLRDVVGLTAEETAGALGTSVSAANSALHRAREALATRVGPRSEARGSPDEVADAPVDRALLERYLRVWEGQDFDAIIALLHEDVTLSMPPHPTWLRGREAVARFLGHRIRNAVEAGRYRTLALEANATPAVAFYRRDDDGVAHFFALHVLELGTGSVRAIDHFMTPSSLRPFFEQGLPLTLPERASA